MVEESTQREITVHVKESRKTRKTHQTGPKAKTITDHSKTVEEEIIEKKS